MCCLFALGVPVAAVEPPAIEWNAALGGTGSDHAEAVQQTSDGGYIVAGLTVSSGSGDVGFNHGLSDCWVVKLDGAGQKVWNTTLGGSNWDEAFAVQQTSDGGYIVAGYTESFDGDIGFIKGWYDAWVVKLDGDGQQVWNTTLGGSYWEVASAVQQTTDGGYIAAGYTDSVDGDVGLTHGGEDFGW